MIFLQGAARRESPAGACLLLVELGAIELLLSHEVVTEIRGVLGRPRLREKFPVLTDDLVEHFVASVVHQATMIQEVPRVFEYSRDPKDEPYLNLAIAGKADYLVSRDTDILDLQTRPRAHSKHIHAYAPQLEILDPVSFLVRMRRIQAGLH
jgi:putative PIN family toxin of toxin-antitoxin system